MTTEIKITETEKIVCECQKTRNGFRHVVEFYRDGIFIESAKVCYLNRTWESFDFETAISKLLEKMNNPDLKDGVSKN